MGLATQGADAGPEGAAGGCPPPAPAASGWFRWLFAGLGCGFVVLGGIGVVVPGVPTTPFLILASYFLLRSSPRLHDRLLRSRTFGPALRDWHRHRGVSRRSKRLAVVACAAMVCLSALFGGLPWLARILVILAGAYGIWFVARLPVVPEPDAARRPAAGSMR